ncbi:MAG: glycosyltransferase family 2 protein [Bacteroidetes bacterium]|nr:glycosyltransferase family 2 protein [Bacteroidota bacterium]
MKNELISIGIPIYNAEKYIESTLLSALNQTYSSLE